MRVVFQVQTVFTATYLLSTQWCTKTSSAGRCAASLEQLGVTRQGTSGIEQNENETFTLISGDVQMVQPAIF